LLWAGLVAVGIFVFFGPDAGPNLLPASLYAPLPFLLWAAVRFGPAITSGALLTMSALTIGGALSGRGPFITSSSGQALLYLQLFIIVVSVPVLILAAAIREREQTLAALNASHRQIQDLAGRLINAQEDERSHIARELHDDVNQQIAALGMAHNRLKRHMPIDAHELRCELAGLQEQMIVLSDTIRQLSYELHPGVLEHVGLPAALRDHCAQFERHHAIAVTFRTSGDVAGVPTGVALCLYRIVEEALHNVAEHSGAQRATVNLSRLETGLELTIQDDGVGFERQTAALSHGLGLIGIQERARMILGSFTIDSQAGRGTTLRILAPLTASPSTTDSHVADLIESPNCP